MAASLKRVLYIDDDTDIQLIARLALEKIGGFTVEICSSGEEAIKKAPVFDPQIILLDVMMPHMNGIQTFSELRKIPKLVDKPIVFMTARDTPADLNQYQEMGACDTISKPFDPMTLGKRVAEIWHNRHRK